MLCCILTLGFPGGSGGRVHLQCRSPRCDPWVRKSPWRREWLPTSVFLPGESHEQGSLLGCRQQSPRVGHDWATKPTAETHPDTSREAGIQAWTRVCEKSRPKPKGSSHGQICDRKLLPASRSSNKAHHLVILCCQLLFPL